MVKLPALGRIFFALAFAAFGIQQLVHGSFVTRALPEWPAWIPGRSLWPYVFGALFIVLAAIILRGQSRPARRAAVTIAAIVFAGALLLHVPRALANPPMWGMLWTNAGKGFALAGGALIIAASFGSPGASPVDRTLVCIGRVLFGAFLVLCGIEHFYFAPYVQPLVPAWIPAPSFWTYFSGAALIAGGVGICVPFAARWAALLTGGMIFAWVVLLHLPRALADLTHPNETTAVFEALAFSGVAFVLAAILVRRTAAPLST